MLKECTVCEAEDAEQLAELVNEKLARGWQPSGGVSVAVAIDMDAFDESLVPERISDMPNAFVVYAQAMVR